VTIISTADTAFKGRRALAPAALACMGIVFGDIGTSPLYTLQVAVKARTWVGGSSALTPAASYGTLGTPAATNTPGGREASAIWQDSSGNFWLFGGGAGSNAQAGTAAGVTNDLWEIVP
jgi:hypothetical protein